jgi:nucleoside-diphosphate-sugar epimerase
MVVITGVSGLVGGNLARALLAQGRKVRGLIHRDRRTLQGLEMELAQADVRDPASLLSALKGAEVVYHLAASISLEMDSWAEVEAINVQGTRNVVDACLQSGVKRLIHFSSIHALQQEPLEIPLDEKRPRVSPSNNLPPYDLSKAAGEEEVHKGIRRGLEAVILNPTAIVGPYDYSPSYFGRAIIALVKGRIPALVAGGFDWVDVRDVVQAALRAEQVAQSGTSYIVSGHWHSVRQVADMVAEVTGTRAPWLSVPIGLAYQVAPAMAMLARFNRSQPFYTRVSLRALHSNRQISHAHATRDLDYNPRPFRETLADTLEWFASNGYLD